MPIHEIELEMPEEVVSEIEADTTDDQDPENSNGLEVIEEPHAIVIHDIPGAPQGTQDLVIEIEEELDAKDETVEEIKEGPVNKWKIPANLKVEFIPWIKQRITECPSHTGYDSPGLERAINYMEHVDSLISKAMHSDLDGDLDATEIDSIRKEIEKGVGLLSKRLDNVMEAKGGKKKKKASEETDTESLVKQAQQAPGVKGVYITVPLFISAMARLCVNGTVSAGHDMEDLFKKCSEKFELTEREKYEVRQLIFDMGFPIRFDRLSWVGEDVDTTSTENGDWSANYGDRG